MFKVGDKVTVTAEAGKVFAGRRGQIYGFGEPSSLYRYSVVLSGEEQATAFSAAELELMDEQPQTATDRQVGGNHYQGKAYQPFDIINEWELGYYRGNVLKYLLRCVFKNGKEDLEKAKHCLEYAIENYDSLNDKGLL